MLSIYSSHARPLIEEGRYMSEVRTPNNVGDSVFQQYFFVRNVPNPHHGCCTGVYFRPRPAEDDVFGYQPSSCKSHRWNVVSRYLHRAYWKMLFGCRPPCQRLHLPQWTRTCLYPCELDLTLTHLFNFVKILSSVPILEKASWLYRYSFYALLTRMYDR